MTDPYTYFNVFSAALAADTTLADWAMANFGRPLNVFEDLEDSEAPDPEVDGPYILFVSQGKRASSTGERISYNLGAWLVLTKAGLITADRPNLTTPTALKLILDFIHYTQQAVNNALPANTEISMEFETDPISMAPEAHAYIDFSFQAIWTVGADPLGLS